MRSSSTPKLTPQSGVTLVELMVVMVIIALVASVAFLNRGSANEQLQRQNGSRQLKEVLERARFDSVKRRADGTTARPFAQVVVHSDRFVLRTYNDVANSNPASTDVTTPLATGVILAHYSSGVLPMTISYNRRGEPSGGVPQFRVCNVSCSSPNGANSDIVLVTPTGTVNLLGGDASLPTFSSPTLLGTPLAGELINDDVVIP